MQSNIFLLFFWWQTRCFSSSLSCFQQKLDSLLLSFFSYFWLRSATFLSSKSLIYLKDEVVFSPSPHFFWWWIAYIWSSNTSFFQGSIVIHLPPCYSIVRACERRTLTDGSFKIFTLLVRIPHSFLLFCSYFSSNYFSFFWYFHSDFSSDYPCFWCFLLQHFFHFFCIFHFILCHNLPFDFLLFRLLFSPVGTSFLFSTMFVCHKRETKRYHEFKKIENLIWWNQGIRPHWSDPSINLNLGPILI